MTVDKRAICEYINKNPDQFHPDLDHIGGDIEPDNIIAINETDDAVIVVANRGIKGCPKYKIPASDLPKTRTARTKK